MSARTYIAGIDGEWTRPENAVGFCTHYQGVLTKNTIELHRCMQRHCNKCYVFDRKKTTPPAREKLSGKDYREKVLGIKEVS